MSENKIAEVAKLLGVEIGEEFFVFNDMGELVGKGKHKFDYKGLWLIYDNKIGSVNQHLIYLLNGTWTIKKIPYKPQLGEDYWSLSLYQDYADVKVCKNKWQNDYIDIMLYRLNFCYTTKEVAEANKSKFQEFLNGNTIIDWEKVDKYE